jgi:hypothetical protein
MGNALNFDARTVAPAQPLTPIPAGTYTAMVVGSEIKPTKDHHLTGGQYLELELKVLEGDHKGRKLFGRLNIKNANPVAEKIAKEQLSALCHAIGKVVITETTDLHGIPFNVKVSFRKGDGQYDDSNEIKGFMPAGGGVAGTAPPAAPAGFASQPTAAPAAPTAAAPAAQAAPMPPIGGETPPAAAAAAPKPSWAT